MFVDASAIVAILTREPERDRLVAAPERSGGATSPIAIYEGNFGPRGKRRSSVTEAGAG